MKCSGTFQWRSSRLGIETFLLVQGNNFVRVESGQYLIIGLGHFSNNMGEVGEQALRRIESSLCNDSCRPIKNLEGSFSLIIIDKTKSKVTIYRNIAGLPCIYYICKNHLTLFSDNLPYFVRVLSNILHEKLTVNRSQLATYFLYTRAQWGETLFNDIHRIMVGEQISFEADKVIRCHIMKLGDMTVSRTEDCVGTLERVMKNIITEYTETYPSMVNMFSGGVDSSYVQAHLSTSSCRTTRTCSVDLTHPIWKREREYACSGSKFFRSDHTFVRVSPSEYPKLLIETISELGIPPGEPQSPLVLKLFKSVKEISPVVICGSCADCLFGFELCEDIDIAYLIEKIMPKSFRWILSKISETLHRKSQVSVLKRLTRILELDLHDDSSPKHPTHLTGHARFEGACQFLGYGEVAKTISQRQGLMKLYKIEGSLKERYQSLRLLSCVYGDGEQFYQLASNVGLKILFPYLDSRLIKAVLSMGELRFPYRLLKTKTVVKDALRNYLPKELIFRKKSSWGLPRAREWMTSGGVLYPLVKELENSSFATYMFRVARTPPPFLWSLLNFNIWHKKFFGLSA